MKPAAAGRQRGGFVMGLVVGLLLGLAMALGVALYITKAPVPFVDKVPQRTAEQDTAEAERNRTWNPNAPLGGRAAAAPRAGAAAASAPPGPPASVIATPQPAPGADPAALLNGGGSAKPAADPFTYFVQAGAYTRNEDAEQQRATLGLNGLTARVSEREQAGRTVWRVRLGPFATRAEADAMQTRLQEQAVEAQIVRVEKPSNP